MKMEENKELDAALRSQGKQRSGPLICEKTLEMNEKIGAILILKQLPAGLCVSNLCMELGNWIFRVKKLSANTEAAKYFKESFKNMIDKEGYNKSNVYNADETGLY
ncbi:hypothetical protein LAZ67_4002452 [Cordylochernes scorpioides]|uniref:Tc1-like transposase DDE domain-containing protein n=1 Tax=Cordylochernes scorpioides TaxID=51811 RepID=A0ABY6KDJ5_9ARAC|nr:hypothetical protein LAZ67_4002452 [Cordylochernes scorpioides]